MSLETFSYHRLCIYAGLVVTIAVLTPTPDPKVIVTAEVGIIGTIELVFQALWCRDSATATLMPYAVNLGRLATPHRGSRPNYPGEEHAFLGAGQH